MPRDGANIYILPSPDVNADTTIESAVYNLFTNDVAADLNTPRPISAGGTGASSADGALTAMGAEKSMQVVTNFDSHVWLAGSFYSATTASGEPVDGHAFSGIVYMADSSNIVVEARDSTDGKLWIRRKVAGIWSAWILDGDLSGVSGDIDALDAAKVAKAGDTMTGMLVLPATAPTLGTHATNKTYVDAQDAAVTAAFTAADTTLTTAVGNRVRYDAAQGLTTSQMTQARQNISAPLRGYLAGLTLSAAGATATFGIAAGEAADSTNVVLMQLASAYTKTAATWAVGSTSGALDTGVISAAAWYHVFLIRRPDTGVVDVLVSLSPTAPTLPTNYTQFRRIGSMKTASSVWLKFSQIGDEFLWDVVLAEVTTNSTFVGGATVTLGGTPTGVQANVLFAAREDYVSGACALYFTALDVLNPTTNATFCMLVCTGASTVAAGSFNIRTNTSAQIRLTGNGTGSTYSVSTYGWIDRRGRDA